MPSSQYYHISKIMEIIIALKPNSVLDVGSGYGKYGVLCREYLDLWNGEQKYEFNKRIDGVEVFNDYITPLHEYIYNNLYNKDIGELHHNLVFEYDLVLLIDVIEHFKKDKGLELLNGLLNKNKGLLISTPLNPSPQEDAFGNIFETHRSVWSIRDLQELGECYTIKDRVSLICYVTKTKETIKDLKNNIRILRKHNETAFNKSLKKALAVIPGAVELNKIIRGKIRK